MTESPELPEIRDRRVLVVDDDQVQQTILTRLLTRAGAEVQVSANGAIGVDLVVAADAKNEPFDLVFMDIVMPKVDGLEATRRIRELGYVVPIIAVTGAVGPIRCYEAGCDSFLAKPFRSADLTRFLRNFFDSREREQQSVEIHSDRG